jgi:hypothetical protein
MEIDANLNSGALNGLGPVRSPATGSNKTQPPVETDSFDGSATLQAALQNTSDIRPEAVARGLALANTDGYPPPSAIKQLSAFLANKLQSND